MASVNAGDDEVTASCLEFFNHYTCPSLPHFIALLCRPTACCVPQGTALIVIDSLSALLNHSFPKSSDGRLPSDPKESKGPPLAVRRLQVLQSIVGALQKLAATQDLAVVILTQCATKMQAEHGATLIPAVNATAWDQGISTRLVLFRDWAPDGAEPRAPHFVGVQKKNGKGHSSLDDVIAFSINAGGLVSVDCDSTETSGALSSTPAQKRKLADTNWEIPDSQDEDHGWQDEEQLLPPMPSQWKGSEDILLEPRFNNDEEEEENQHEEEAEIESVASDQDEESMVGEPVYGVDRLQKDPSLTPPATLG